MQSYERNPADRAMFHDLVSLVYEIRPNDEAEHLDLYETAGDLFSREDEEVAGEEFRVGYVWDETPDILRDGESIRLCICDEEGRYSLGALLRSEYGVDQLPIAFVEFLIEKPTASFATVAYLLESGEVAALIETAMNADEVLSEESEACFDFANQLGLGSYWAKAMFNAFNSGTNTTEEMVGLDSSQVEKLHGFLNHLKNRV